MLFSRSLWVVAYWQQGIIAITEVIWPYAMITPVMDITGEDPSTLPFFEDSKILLHHWFYIIFPVVKRRIQQKGFPANSIATLYGHNSP